MPGTYCSRIFYVPLTWAYRFYWVLMWSAKGRVLKSEHKILMTEGLHCKCVQPRRWPGVGIRARRTFCQSVQRDMQQWVRVFCPLEGELHAQPGAPRAGDTWGQLNRARAGLVSWGCSGCSNQAFPHGFISSFLTPGEQVKQGGGFWWWLFELMPCFNHCSCSGVDVLRQCLIPP